MSETPNGFEDFFRIQNELNEIFTRALEGTLSTERVTVPQAFTLKALKEQGETCRMSDLAAMRFHTPAAMTGIVDRLIDLKLVQRSSDAKDRRVILIELTEPRQGDPRADREKGAEHDGAVLRERSGRGPRERRCACSSAQKFLKEEINAQKKT